MQPPEEESSPASCEINVDAFKKVYSSILPYVSWKDLLSLRRVCKKMDEVVRESGRFSTNVLFKVCNNPLSLETFAGLSQNFPVKQFSFEGLDLETSLFADQTTFQRFAMGHCQSMSALVIRKCTLSTGRFLELLAFCKNLRHLGIRDSPSIFRVDNGIGLVHWSFCFKSVRTNLANLQKLSIAGKNLRDVDVWGLGVTIRGLKELQVLCDQNLPMDGINKIVKSSHKTLKVLILRGIIHFPGLAVDTDMEMKSLQKLQLDRNKFDTNTMIQLESFLEKCPCLIDLQISLSKLQKTTLSKVTSNLIRLRLWNCEYDAGSFVDVKFPNLQKLSLCTGIQLPFPAFLTQQAMRGLSHCNMPKLTEVDLRLLSNGADYLRSLNICNQLQLTILSLSNCADIAGPSLREIFKNLFGLLSLSITKCVELNDDNVCPGANNDERESLANLQELKSLDLSGTGVGNKVILQCIVKMEQLKSIKLNDDSIKVDKVGLQTIMKATETSLKLLKDVSVNKCKISCDEYKSLRLMAPQVTLECLIETSYGTVTTV